MTEAGSPTGSKFTSCPQRCSNGYERAILSVQRRLEWATGSVGAFVARYPVWVVVGSILLTIACGIGWLTFKIESATDKLWVPQNSQAMKDRDWVSDTYASGGGFAQVLGTVASTREQQYGKNALQLPIFWELFQVDMAVRGINVSAGGRTYSWSDLCDVNFDGDCKYSGPLNLWNMSFNSYLGYVNGSATDPTAGNRGALIQAVNQQRFPDDTAISTLSIFGGITLSALANPPVGRPPLYMSAAEVVAMPYSLRDGLGDDVQDKWYDKFLDVMKEWAAKSNYTALAYIAGNSVEQEIGKSVTNDLYLIVISVALFILVAVVGLSRWHWVGTRSSLALLGVVSSVLAMVAGYGLSLVFGCPFNTLSQTLPYVLLGLSVDCMFILVKAYDGVVAADPAAPLESRFRRLMSSAGTSVVVTLLASAVAFALGAISELPAVQWFSVYATMGVTCILVATLTFFSGVFVLTERRIAANRLDCCCCLTSGGPLLPTAATCLRENPPDGSSSSSSDGGGDVKSAAGAPVLSAIVLVPQQQSPPSRGPVAESVEGGPTGQPQQQGVTVMPGQPASPVPSVTTGSSSPTKQQAAVPQVVSLDGTTYVAQLPSLDSPGGQAAAAKARASEPNVMKALFKRYYAPFLTRWWAKALVLLVFVGWAVLSGVGIPRLREGQPLSELAPDDSYLQDYVRVTTDTFQQQIGSPAALYYRWFDPANPQQQARMLQALADTLDNPYVNSTVSAFQGNWLLDYIAWVQNNYPNVTLVTLDGCSNPFIGRVYGDLGLFVQPRPIKGCVPQDQFYPLLNKFLSSHRGYLQDLDFTGGAVWTSRLPIVHTAEGDNGAYGRELIKSIDRLVSNINNWVFSSDNAVAPGDVFLMFNGNYIYYAGDAVLGLMTMEYVLLAVAGVGVVLTLTLPSLRAVLLMMLAVGLVDYFLFGQMFILDIRFNQVSIINMIMATGLSVDYSVYFAQRFVMVTADGTRNGRMAEALSDTGSAVFVGGLTALIGTIPLAFSTSTILRVFFALIFGTICFALLVGLMLMPVVFSLVGPPPLSQAQAADQGKSKASVAASSSAALRVVADA